MANYNLTKQNNYKVEIPGCPDSNFFIQNMSFPSVNMREVDSPYLNKKGVVPGNYIDFSPLSITYLMDEEYKIWQFMFEWIMATREADISIHWTNITKDITAHILSSNKTSLLTFTYANAFPVSLNSFPFDSGDVDTQNIMLSVDFQYEYLNYRRSTTVEVKDLDNLQDWLANI